MKFLTVKFWRISALFFLIVYVSIYKIKLRKKNSISQKKEKKSYDKINSAKVWYSFSHFLGMFSFYFMENKASVRKYLEESLLES